MPCSYCMMAMNCRNPVSFFLCSVLFVSYSLAFVSHAANTITQDQVIRDGETVVSANQVFVLGFFSPDNSTSRYVGIWYYKSSLDAVVWVANRANPVSGRNGVLTIGRNGDLVVLDGSGTSIWSANASVTTNSTTAILMDSGNLVLLRSKDVSDTEKAYWQSFENPTDTFLPGMRVPTKKDRIFRSWKSAIDPSPGTYSMGIDTRASPQVVIWEQSNRWWRSGHWNGLTFTGIPEMRALYLYGFKFAIDDKNGDQHFIYNAQNSSDIIRFWLRWDGKDDQLKWDDGSKKWNLVMSFPGDDCETYNKCGNFGRCNQMGSPLCSCIDGFEPRNAEQWDKGNWTGGCVRRTPLQCKSNGSTDNEDRRDGFLEMVKVKLPDFADGMDVRDGKACENECLKNCSCNAYAFVSGISCMLWRGDLIDVEQFADGGNTLYIRLDDSELGSKRKISTGIIVALVVAGAIFVSMLVWLLQRFKGKFKDFSGSSKKITLIPGVDANRSRELSEEIAGPADILGEGKQGNGQELPLFHLSSIEMATNYFSFTSRLGEGGFGPVYKGKLPGGEEIAVKRLSKMSGQGVEEFKNEIILIAKLQHRNLVRLLGCCIEGEEKMLIYEHMPNGSLDSFLFDPAKRAHLDWTKRATIIEGIARGLIYLHRDSRLRIIHRDLKASNILLDDEMNPKISDFGMARIFGGNQHEANTNRVVGTYGYMSPEYAMEGLFSVKSDVYSFGILLLEIVSGRRNSSFRLQDRTGLIGYVWQLWNEGRAMEFVDTSLGTSLSQSEVIRCMHVGILCVQDSAANRPTMSSVLLMLGSEAANLPAPKQPTFSSIRSSLDMDSSLEGHDLVSSNDVTMTAILGR